MGFVSVLSYAQQLVKEHVRAGKSVIDATVGNGVDTLFLANLVGERGKVYGFDIQDQALANARLRLEGDLQDHEVRVKLFHDSHHLMEQLVPVVEHGNIGAVMFNLGYLPGSDQSIITCADTTIPALEAALRLVAVGSVVTIVLYPGHDGGDLEADLVSRWAADLPRQSFQTLRYQFINANSNAPYLIAVTRRSRG